MLSLLLSNTDLPQKAQRELYLWYNQAVCHFSSKENGFEMAINAIICQVVVCHNSKTADLPEIMQTIAHVCVCGTSRAFHWCRYNTQFMENTECHCIKIPEISEQSSPCTLLKSLSGTRLIFRKLEMNFKWLIAYVTFWPFWVWAVVIDYFKGGNKVEVKWKIECWQVIISKFFDFWSLKVTISWCLAAVKVKNQSSCQRLKRISSCPFWFS